MKKWEMLWENFVDGSRKDKKQVKEAESYPLPYISGKAKPSEKFEENISELFLLVGTATELAQLEPGAPSNKVEDTLDQIMSVLDDMYEIVRKISISQSKGEIK